MMTALNTSYQIFPLGDSAITIDFGNCIDEEINQQVIARFNQLREQPLPGMIEAVPAYSSLTIYYDILAVKKKIPADITVMEWMTQLLNNLLKEELLYTASVERKIHIPVCYEEKIAPDLKYVSFTNNISIEDIVKTHTSKPYKVFMLGFLPGFSYMGEVDEKIAIPRKPQPVNIAEGSVGIAGKQTGIYPLASPGGWQIIGRTPEKLFDASKEESTLLRAGDIVQFYSINKKEFEERIKFLQMK